MEEKILNIIETSNKALTYEEIMNKLEENEKDELGKILVQLQKQLKIRFTNKGKYEKNTDNSQKVGILSFNPRGYGFVKVDGENEDYFIAKNNINGAVDKDEVIIQVLDEEKKEAIIKNINERNLKDVIVGEFYIKDGKNFINLEDDKLKIIVEIDKDKTKNAVPGHKVIVKLLENTENTNYYKGEIIRIIGHKDDAGVDILTIAAKYDVFDVFPETVEKELENIPSEVKEEEFEGRRDLRKEMIFTIDGDDTKDIDDAISLKASNGNYELGVHIADVSYYVKEGSPLYDEAYTRGTSNYLADKVIPMLPHQLSNGICSLNPNVDRLTISCVMEIDKEGNIVATDIFESVIKSRKQMTYKNVNKIIEENTVPEGYEEFAGTLKKMHTLAKILRKNKTSKGYIDFDTDEPKIIVDETGKAIDIQKRIRGEGEKLIEDFMIAANEAVAETIFHMELPFIYRVHGTPDEEKIGNFLKLLGVLGYKINANLNKITPHTIQGILNQIKEKPEYPILSNMLLRSMQKAVYDVTNIGHFGLGSKCYTHFTSPIRRFPDLNVHRLLRTYLFKHNINNETINHFNKILPNITKQSSERERAAVDCERDVNDMKMAEYMLSHIGEEYKGVINTVANYGMYVELDNMVEGLIRVEDIPGDYYIYQESGFCLIGKSSKKRYTLGQKIDIIVDAVDKDKGEITFKLAKKGDKNGDKQQKSQI
ncbi:MAG: ribonuclease R [Bacilli bacterium]|nr:ribonuclease R [Bacilli bacterium]